MLLAEISPHLAFEEKGWILSNYDKRQPANLKTSSEVVEKCQHSFQFSYFDMLGLNLHV